MPKHKSKLISYIPRGFEPKCSGVFDSQGKHFSDNHLCLQIYPDQLAGEQRDITIACLKVS